MIPRGLPHSLANLGDVPVSWLTLLWSTAEMRGYREYVADQRMQRLGLPEIYGSANPLAFMEPKDVQELSNFFERTVSAYQVGVSGDVDFDEEF